MVNTVEYRSQALVVRATAGAERLKPRVEIWQPETSILSHSDIDFPALADRPYWVQGPETVRLGDASFAVSRVNLPPLVHFRQGPQLQATSIFLAVEDDASPSDGSWISADLLLDQVDSQWKSLLGGLCSQYASALATGYLKRQHAAQLSGSKTNRLSPKQPSQPQSAAEISGSEGETSERFERPWRPSCSGYEEENHAWGMEDGGEAKDSSNHFNETRLSEEEGQEASTVASESAREPTQWQSGSVAVIEGGGRDVQSVLDSNGVKLGIVHWHAPWIEACLELQPYLQRLAARFQSVAVVNLDVEQSMANKLLAYEKVLTRSESRRRGAKPIVRDNQSFPCLTVHDPCNLNPLQTYCGKEALDNLAVGALVHRSKELTEPPQVQKAVHSQHGEQAAIQAASTQNADSALIKREEEASPPVQIGGRSKNDEPLQNLKIIKRGAMELRQHLYQAKQTGQPVVVLWISGTASSQDWWPKFAAEHPGDVFLLVDVTLGKDNRQLAVSLKVKSYPTAQVYQNLKLVKHLDQKGAAKGLEAALASVLAIPPVPAASSTKSAEHRSSVGKDTNPLADNSIPTAAPAALEKKEDTRQEATAGGKDCFDPPKQASKSEQKRRFPSGTGTYWPKMPCLRCGCPWWLGEDWDARCARCQWTAESDGYDDDSKPLPVFKAKYKEFTEIIKAGSTSPWQHAA